MPLFTTDNTNRVPQDREGKVSKEFIDTGLLFLVMAVFSVMCGIAGHEVAMMKWDMERMALIRHVNDELKQCLTLK